MTSRYRTTPQGELQGNGTPALSIAIASVNGYRYIAQCHRSLAKQRYRDRGEVIVVKGCADVTAMRVAQEFLWVRPIACATPKPIPEMRSIGNREAKTPIVTTTEDHCVFENGSREYKRDVLEKVCGDLLDQLRAWVNVLHGLLLARGMELRIDPAIVVYQAKVLGFERVRLTGAGSPRGTQTEAVR
jgi:hypothetical protein